MYLKLNWMQKEIIESSHMYILGFLLEFIFSSVENEVYSFG